jgi:putative ABC transport system permease protein
VVWGSQTWKVVGVFEAGGSVSESEVWTDLTVLQGVYRRGNSVQIVRVRLESPASLGVLERWLDADPRIDATVRTERDFYADQSRILIAMIRYVGTTIALLMGIGAVFAALNTMYSAVSTRTREIATLRALGFGAAPVVVSVLLEAMVLGLLGGVAGGALVYAALNGYQASTLNFASFSQVTFAFTVTPGLLVTGLGYSLILGLVGGLLPALRAARLPVTEGLREL